MTTAARSNSIFQRVMKPLEGAGLGITWELPPGPRGPETRGSKIPNGRLRMVRVAGMAAICYRSGS